MISKPSIPRLWRRLKGRLHAVTITGLILLLYSSIPNVPFWYALAREVWPSVYGFASTAGGRLLIILVGLALIYADQHRLNRKSKSYDLLTLQGRTMQLRDEIQAFLNSAPLDAGERENEESAADYASRVYNAHSRRTDYLVHGFEWRFSDRALIINYQFGERGLLDHELWSTLTRQPMKKEENYKVIIEALTRLAEHSESATGAGAVPRTPGS